MPDTAVTDAIEIDFASPQGAGGLVKTTPTSAVPAPAPVAPVSMLDIIDRASRDPSVDIDKLERLIGLKKDMEAQQARVEFDRAMVAAQGEMRAVRADLENPQTRSKYASYAQLDKAIRPIYSKHGFAVSFNTGDAPRENELRVLATLSHAAGHRQDYRIDMPADGKGARGNDVMTKTHATGAAASYGQRYLYKLMFNLAVGDVDDDGNGADGISDEERLSTGPRDPETGKLLSTYDAAKNARAKDIADRIVQALNLSPNREAAKEIWAAEHVVPPRKRQSPLGWLKDNAPGQHLRCQTAYENVVGLE